MVQISDCWRPGMTDSECVRAALAAVAGEKERILVFSGRDFWLDEAVLLSSDMTVIVDGCALRQKDDTFDNVFRGDNLVIDPVNPFGAPLNIRAIANIRILGRNGAAIIGPNRNRRSLHPHFNEEQEMVGDFWGWRTHQISLSRCEQFEISGLVFRQTRGWTISCDFCSDGVVRDIEFDSRAKNGDGVDFRIGCHHCVAEDLRGHTLDDTVACTALNNPVTPPRYLYPSEPAKRLFRDGDPRLMDIHDIIIRRLHVSGEHHAVICLAANGIQVYNIHISEISEAGERACHLVDLYTGYGEGYLTGDLHDIQISAVTANTTASQNHGAAVACRASARNIAIQNIVQLGSGDKLYLPCDDGVICR